MSPRLLHIFGPFWITSYGLFIVLGIAAFMSLAYHHSGRSRYLSHDNFFDIAASGTLGGILGGKLLFLLQEAPVVSSFSQLFELALTGFAILGAIVGGIVGIAWYAYDHKLALWSILDLGGIYAPVALAIGRWGCLFGGCCFGQVMATTRWWSFVYTDPTSLAPLHTPLYPTQLMLSVGSLLVFLFLRFVLYPMRVRAAGVIFAAYLAGESIVRFVVDFWRGDRDLTQARMLPGIHYKPWIYVWSFHQKVAVWLIVGALALLVYRQWFAAGRKGAR